jgi:hypothetical protein
LNEMPFNTYGVSSEGQNLWDPSHVKDILLS